MLQDRCLALACVHVPHPILLGFHTMHCFPQKSGQEVLPDESAAVSDPLRFGPKPDQLIPKLAQDGQGGEAGVYRPPKLNPVSMDNDPDKDYGKKERRRQQHAARKAGRSEFVQALASELEGAPEEVSPCSRIWSCCKLWPTSSPFSCLNRAWWLLSLLFSLNMLGWTDILDTTRDACLVSVLLAILHAAKRLLVKTASPNFVVR